MQTHAVPWQDHSHMAPSNGPPTTGTSPEPDASMASYFTASRSSSESRPAGFGRVAHRVPQPATHGLSVRCLPGRAAKGRPCRDAAGEFTEVTAVYPVPVTSAPPRTEWPTQAAGHPDAKRACRWRARCRCGTDGRGLSTPRVQQVQARQHGRAGCGGPPTSRWSRTLGTRAPAEDAALSMHSTGQTGNSRTGHRHDASASRT